MTLLLNSARRAGEGERLVRSGRWQGWHPTHMLSTQVTGKTLGIVGMGRIGLALLDRLTMGSACACFTAHGHPAPMPCCKVARAVRSLSELLAASDFVSLHCPASPETHHLINAQSLALMKPTAHDQYRSR